AGLATGDYQTPMKDDLLWVYEGLTEYLGYVLAARSGSEEGDEVMQDLAYAIDAVELNGGRSWRSLEDTAVAAQLLYGAPAQWTSARRSVDYYDESVLLWLDVDMHIRQLSGGKKSIDDFCRAFHGGHDGQAALSPYGFDDVVQALNAVVPYDWAALLRAKVSTPLAHVSLDGLNAAGWTLGTTDDEPTFIKTREGERKIVDVRYSLGFIVGADDMVVLDVLPNSPAWNAGMAPGMKLVGVGGRKYNKDVLEDLLKASKNKKAPPIDVLLENGEFYRELHIDYHGGPRWPALVRVPGKPDVLHEILAPKTPHAARTKDAKDAKDAKKP
ncbi:MAG TPA: M61 family peptidase, partial [Myxococcota bacterium]